MNDLANKNLPADCSPALGSDESGIEEIEKSAGTIGAHMKPGQINKFLADARTEFRTPGDLPSKRFWRAAGPPQGQ